MGAHVPSTFSIACAETMTVRHLLRHQAGLPDHPHLRKVKAAAAARIAERRDGFTPEGILGFFAGPDPLFPAGTVSAYSDTGNIFLGLLVEEVSKRSYYVLVLERFLGTLDFAHTLPFEWRDIPGLAVGYTIPSNAFGVPVSPNALGILCGAGVGIYAYTPRSAVYGHGGWISVYVSSLCHYAGHGVTVTFPINTDTGIINDSTDLVPALEVALADLAVAGISRKGGEP